MAGYTLPPGSCLYQDKGFQGFVLEGIMIFHPTKKPPGGELTSLRKPPIVVFPPSESALNTPLGGVKRYRIVKDKLRLLKDGLRDIIMETCCGLHNFRLLYRTWNYA